MCGKDAALIAYTAYWLSEKTCRYFLADFKDLSIPNSPQICTDVQKDMFGPLPHVFVSRPHTLTCLCQKATVTFGVG